VPQRLFAGAGNHDLADVLEHRADGEEIMFVVIDHQDARRTTDDGVA